MATGNPQRMRGAGEAGGNRCAGPLCGTAGNGLSVAALDHRHDASRFGFATTAELEDLDGPPFQDRAIDAIEFALAMQRPGYNFFAVGSEGLGKRALVQRLVQQRAAGRPVPPEHCYVNNFRDPHRPRVLTVPAGRGQTLKSEMAKFVLDAKAALLAAFKSDDHRAATQTIERETANEQEAALQEVRAEAERRGLKLLRTPVGFAFAPVRENHVLAPEEFEKLPPEEQQKWRADIEYLEGELKRRVEKFPLLIGQAQEKLRAVNDRTARFAISHLTSHLKQRYADLPEVCRYLEEVEADVIENASSFLSAPEQVIGGGSEELPAEGPTLFWRYRVNLLVERTGAGAPVVVEDEPTFEHLLGRIENRAEMGTLKTDFNLIRPGSLHRAHGGYLILDAFRLLRQPLAWDALKRVLESKEIRIESLATALGFGSTMTLEPEPIQVDIKVIVIGPRWLYYLLAQYDPDLPRLFKVLADFDEVYQRGDSADLFARWIATLGRGEQLLPFDREAVASLLDLATRDAEDAQKVSADAERMRDAMCEAHFLAERAERKAVTREDVLQARRHARQRASRIYEHLLEAIQRETVVVETEGTRIGQVNGLSVFRLGDFDFGRPTRITARVALGRGEVVDIERLVQLGGPLHSKGVLILSGYLAAQYAPRDPLSLSASLVFEQSYVNIDGDSASAAELFALLSAIAEIPMRQSIATTGSVDQHGRIQAIGGVNEKIEAFFDLCQARGLSGAQGVLIPAANIDHLLLAGPVLEAVAAERFHIWSITTVDEGLELLSGLPAGRRGADGEFTAGSFNASVLARLRRFAACRRDYAASGKEGPERSL